MLSTGVKRHFFEFGQGLGPVDFEQVRYRPAGGRFGSHRPEQKRAAQSHVGEWCAQYTRVRRLDINRAMGQCGNNARFAHHRARDKRSSWRLVWRHAVS